jgi:hypothetical protein
MELLTKDGRSILLRPVGRRYVEQVMAKHPIPAPPTYTITTIAGDVETHAHDEKSIAETPEDKPKWDQYLADRMAATTARYQAATDFLIYNCVVEEPPPLSEWSMDFALWGLEPPDSGDKAALKVFWVENELCPDLDDQAALIAEVYQIGGIVAEDRVRQFESFFRLALGRQTPGRPGRAAPIGAAHPGTEGRDGDGGEGAVCMGTA